MLDKVDKINKTNIFIQIKNFKSYFYDDYTLGEGTMLYVVIILSGYSSRIFDIKSVPIPEPVPPPSEWVNWNPCKQSQLSASFLKYNMV